jgi:sulfite exporter TauE/SafE
MNSLDIYLAFSLGVIGSLHCIQMCGPIVLAYSLPIVTYSRRQQIIAHFSYNSGRIVTYGVLGAIAGLAGGWLGKLAGVEHVVVIIAGSLMIVAGLLMSGLLPSGPLGAFYRFRPASFFTQKVGGLLKSPTLGSKFSTGILLGFLPCGLVYTALLKAMETGSLAGGILTMICFGVGTAWSLMLLGLFSSTVSVWLRKRANALAAIGVTLMGCFLVYRGIMASMHQSLVHH